MLTKVGVIQADISNGIRYECTCCPVALAINRLLKRAFQVSVKPGYIVIRRKRINDYNDCDILSYRGDNYRLVSTFIRKFDVDGYVEPFSFEIDIPDKFLAQVVDVEADK